MAITPSAMVPLGTPMPAFSLPDTVTGEEVVSSDLRGCPVVVLFLCNHCPYVKHVNAELVRVANDYMPRGIRFVAISANDAVAYPEDGPEAMREAALRLGYPFAYLYDESQAVARAFDAACTPDLFVYDAGHRLVYRGQLDDARPSLDLPLTGRDLRAALDAVLEGRPVASLQRPAVGCNIKWKG